jgi:putative molybdopterin biosynthesis protein
MEPRLTSTLRAERLARRLSQGALARRAGISRQSYSAIESGASVPATDVALRLAEALATTVESLFRLAGTEGESVEARFVGSPPVGPVRVRLGRVAGRLLAYAAEGAAAPLGTAADGVARPLAAGGVRVELAAERPQEVQLVVLGCDPAFGMVVEQLRRERGVEVLWASRPSRAALASLAAGEAHVIGMHLGDPESGEYNGPWVRRLVPFACTRVGFALWEQDLLVGPGNPLGIRGVADLARPTVRFLNRDPGSGSRALLDARLAEAGVPGDAIPGYAATSASGHLAVAESIASGLADAGVGIRAAGRALGLSRVPLGQERYDLVIPDHFLDLPAVQALLDVLRGRSLRTQVEMLGGYDASGMGLPAPGDGARPLATGRTR